MSGLTQALTSKGWSRQEALARSTRGFLTTTTLPSGRQVSILRAERVPMTRGDQTGRLADVDDVQVTVNDTSYDVLDVDPRTGLVMVDGHIPEETSIELDYYHTPGGLVTDTWGLDETPFFPAIPRMGSSDRPQPLARTFQWAAYDAAQEAIFGAPNTKFGGGIDKGPSQLVERTSPVDVLLDGTREWTEAGWVLKEGGSSLTTRTSHGHLHTTSDVPVIWTRSARFFEPYRGQCSVRWVLPDPASSAEITVGWNDRQSASQAGVFAYQGEWFLGMGRARPDTTDRTDLALSYEGRHVTREDQDPNRLQTHSPLPFVEGDTLLLDRQGTFYRRDVISTDATSCDLDQALPSGTYRAFVKIPPKQETSFRVQREDQHLLLFGRGRQVPMAKLPLAKRPLVRQPPHDINPHQVWAILSPGGQEMTVEWDRVQFGFEPVHQENRTRERTIQTRFDRAPASGWVPQEASSHQAQRGEDMRWVEQGGSRQGWIQWEPYLESGRDLWMEARMRVDGFAQGSPLQIVVVDDRKEATLALFEDPSGSSTTTFDLTGGQDLLALDQVAQRINRANQQHEFQIWYPGDKSFSDVGWQSSFDADQLEVTPQWTRIQSSEVRRASHQLQLGATASQEHAAAITFRSVQQSLDTQGWAPWRWVVSSSQQALALRVRMHQGSPQIVILDGNGQIYEAVDWDWTEEGFHSYRWVVVDDHLSLFIDGQFQTTVSLPQAWSATAVETAIETESRSTTLDVKYAFAHSFQYDDREWGLYQGDGSRWDPDHYERRADEWLGEFLSIRLRMNPEQGLEIYTHQSNSPRLSVPYESLPERQPESPEFLPDTERSSFVMMGSFDPRARASIVWDRFDYQILPARSNATTFPTRSTFGRSEGQNMITSPEPVYDEMWETVDVTATGHHTVPLDHLEGRRIEQVISIQDMGDSSTFYTFQYNENTQTVHLDEPLSAPDAAVRVTYESGARRSLAYLRRQTPYLRLFEGTPPFIWSRMSTQQRNQVPATRFGSESTTFGRARFGDQQTMQTWTQSGDLTNLDVNTESSGTSGLLSPAFDHHGMAKMAMGRFEDQYAGVAEVGDSNMQPPLTWDDPQTQWDRPSTQQWDGVPTRQTPMQSRWVEYRRETYDGLQDQMPTGEIVERPDALVWDSLGFAWDSTPSEDEYGAWDDTNTQTTTITFDQPYNY